MSASRIIFSLHDDEEPFFHDDASLDLDLYPASTKEMLLLNHNKLSPQTHSQTLNCPNGTQRSSHKGKDGVYRVLPPASQEEQFADEKERKARTLLLMAVPKDHLRRFHGMDDAKEIWAAIKTRFGGNANSKKMQKAVLKQQFEAFTISSKESLEKGSKEGNRQEAGRGQDFKPVRTEKEALMTIDEGQINWVEQTTDEELNHALMAFTVNNEVSMCSKLCLDTYNALQAKYDELQSEFGDQEAALVAHKLAVKKLESQLKASHKQQSSLTEKLNFQANQIFEKDEKLKKYRRIGMKAVKDKDALQKIVDSWFASSKNLWKLIDCGRSQLETDAGYYDIPLYSRFKQVEYKGVPHPLVELTPRDRKMHSGFSSGSSRFNTGKQNVNSGRVHVNTARVNRPVLSNQTSNKTKLSQVNLKSPKKCFSKQSSPVNRPFSRNTAYKSNKYAVKGKMGTAVKTSAGCVWRKAIPLSNTNSGPTPNSNVNVSRGPQGRPKPVKAWVTRINWRILKNSIGDLLPLEETDIQEKDTKKAKNIQNQARNGKEKVKSKPKSSKCGNQSEASSNVEDFYGVELNVKGLKSLDDYLSVEELQGDKQYFCSSRATHVDATRSIKLQSLPPVLIFQLKPCIFLPNTTTKKKITSAFCFPGQVNMALWLSEQSKSELTYDLSAVLIHKGSTVNSGHYVAHTKDQDTRLWWEFNDDVVTELGNHPFGGNSSKSSAKPLQTVPAGQSGSSEPEAAANGNHMDISGACETATRVQTLNIVLNNKFFRKHRHRYICQNGPEPRSFKLLLDSPVKCVLQRLSKV
ncbi:ubiquitin carboxyl-terminal hydrolase 26 [Tanacetum coccineum]|uniref:ubiquitinyl hydrolase 1 n=1 Tax=Tanacetum coccineum TaxID=301880 RepID=A0ABQ5EF43_9ASTR